MEYLLKTEGVKIINNHRAGNLPEWNIPAVIQIEDTKESVFDIVDTKDNISSIVCLQNTGDATYYNGLGTAYHLRFIKYDEFLNQFRISDNGIISDWAKDIARPDYICYTVDEKKYFIIHELSKGEISSKRKKARTQLVNCIQFLKKSNIISEWIAQFEKRLCFVSAHGCVEATPNKMADAFNNIYDYLPDPLPLKCITFERNNYCAYETKVVKL